MYTRFIALCAFALTLQACSSIESTILVAKPDGTVVKGPTVRGVVGQMPQTVAIAFPVYKSGVALDEAKEIKQAVLFATDLPRPFAGTAKQKIKSDGYYPGDINTDVDDQTLETVTSTFEKLLAKMGEGGAQDQGAPAVSPQGTDRGQVLYLLVWDLRPEPYGGVYKMDPAQLSDWI